jgi:hypothetical protein
MNKEFGSIQELIEIKQINCIKIVNILGKNTLTALSVDCGFPRAEFLAWSVSYPTLKTSLMSVQNVKCNCI